MGKGNRTRNNNYQEAYNMSGTSSAKTVKTGSKKTDRTGLWVTLVIALLIVASLALWFFSSSGVVERGTTVISTDNYKVDATMITYYENQLYSTAFNQYYSYYYQYFTQGDANAAYTYAQQAMQEQTLASYYDEALDLVKEILILCESAKAEGITLDSKDKEDIDAVVSQYDGVIKQNFGTGVKKSDLRKAVEIQVLASKYYDEFNETTKSAITADEISKYIDENKADFYVADYLVAPLGILAEDYEGDVEGFAAAKALVDEYADKMKKSTTAEEFKTLLVEFTVKNGFDALVATEIDSDLVPDKATLNTYEQTAIDYIVKSLVKEEAVASKSATEGSLEYAMLTIEETLKKSCQEALDKAEASQAYVDAATAETAPTEEIKWLIDDARKEGDTNDSKISDETEYTITVYRIEKPLHIDKTLTKNVGHILIEAAKATATEAQIAEAKAKAETVLAEFKAGDKTEDSFEEIGLANTSDSNVFYDNVTEGYMVAEFNDWLFDEARKVGDTDIVQTDFGFHVMLYRGEEIISDAKAKAGIISDKYSDFLKSNESKVVINEKAAQKYGA